MIIVNLDHIDKREEVTHPMKQLIGKIHLSLAFILAGTSVITARIVSVDLGVFTVTATSLGLLLLCLLPLYAARIATIVKEMRWSDWNMILLQAGFGIFGFRLFLLLGLNLTSAGEAGILTGATPAITALMAWLILRETPSGKGVLGIGLTVAGILLLQGLVAAGGTLSSGHAAGNLLVLCAAACESCYHVLSRKHMISQTKPKAVGIPPMIQMLLVAFAAFLLCLVPAMAERPLASLRGLYLPGWAALAWYGLGITALAFYFWYEGITRCSASTAAVFSGLIPLTAMVLSVALLREKPEPGQWIGGLMVLAGIVVLGGRTARRKAIAPDLGI